MLLQSLSLDCSEPLGNLGTIQIGLDPGYQCHKRFDKWQEDGKSFTCRIKAGTKKVIIKNTPIPDGSIVFYDAVVLLGTSETSMTEKEERVVGYKVKGVKYWIATNRHDLSGEQIGTIYKLRWDIEKFFRLVEKASQGLSPDCSE